ncbi:hypothetical protein [Romboutsia sp.]|uniref:hypothetical protein n=1 Tax=Romboutsia sp. TaxID=1965302 RepID=UPI002BB25621|nr:hypothetical protein [Romboutsia sp.]HSQ89835.1 hypothetical protein [Romboutsia sp.]
MQLVELKQYIENDTDKVIINTMIKDEPSVLNKFIINVICDLLEGINLGEEYKINARNNINSYDEKSIGEVGTYVSLIPYVQSALKNNKDGYVITSTFIEMLISYIIGYIKEEEFLINLSNMIKVLQISDKLYNGLISYFSFNKKDIVEGINERLK